MEPIKVIFKVGTEFYKACKEYLLIKKVEELQHDIELIKGSFFSNALDFVEKASACENIENTRFFLESAYGNFSQSVRIYSDSVDKFMDAATIYAIKDGIADFVKFEGTNTLSRCYNKAVDGVTNNAADKEKADKGEKECLILEMSIIGKAMCEYYMKEFSLCVESIDNAIGAHIKPWLKMVGLMNMVCSDSLLSQSVKNMYVHFLRVPLEECLEYFHIQNVIASEYGVTYEKLEQRNRIVRLLKNSADRGDEYSKALLYSMNNSF